MTLSYFKKLCIALLCGIICTSKTNSLSKALQFVQVKKSTGKNSMFPFNRDFFAEIQQIFNIQVFVETGTYKGNTCAIASTVFKEVHTVELSKELFNYATQRFAHMPKVFLYQGDSGILLAPILSKIEPTQRIALLLDSHWSGGDTARGDDVPILRELACIKKSGIKNCVILIDDIRCFQKQSPTSGDSYPYPDLSEITGYIHEINDNYRCLIYGDILLAYTDSDITVPAIVQAMTISRLNEEKDEILGKVETIIGKASEQDFFHLAHLANDLDTSTGFWRTHYYDFWYALALYNRGDTTTAYQYMKQAADTGSRRAQYYLSQL